MKEFVPDFARIAVPITNLLKKNQPFEWNAACNEAFTLLKELLTQASVLIPPNPTLPYLLTTDASDYAIGAALFHLIDGKERPVAYWGRKLNEHEVRYNTTEREALAVVEALKQFRIFLWGLQFTLETDHRALVDILNLKDRQGRIARWLLVLQEFNFTPKYRPGPKIT